jgi:hypothetical protein
MNVVLVVLISLILVMVVSIMGYALVGQYVTRARRYAVTLKNNEGAFIALCTQKRWGRWTFEDVKITPSNPGGEYRAAAPGKLYVPTANILYYQEISEVANVSQ